ncbi:DUF5367 domain-containing protein [Aureibacillus halotolerans]|uniref:Uncharacterized protein n=1 Tax=Aureibacillus halotolerans TaxID=1508390 RepID=A0A4V3D4S0_9BACI|nr:DUF5367 domain-containing protein [Aureibacillus halotolerans]TDQ36987.1 hypothetical protein EV213_11581 [Aureibacillus halotolerans]
MFFLLYGFLVWLGASVIFRLAGQFFFVPGQPILLIWASVLVIPLVAVLTLPLYHKKKLNSEAQLKAAICIALPGMVLDTVVLLSFDSIFVNLDQQMDGTFGSWLLFAYSLVLVSGFLPLKLKIFKRSL